MSDIERPDWNYPAPVKGGDDTPLPGSSVVVPASRRDDLAPSELLAEMEGNPPAQGSAFDPVAGLSNQQIGTGRGTRHAEQLQR